jgi:carboxyl-terminal processing protease
VYRPSTAETLDFDVERRNVVLPSVEGEMLSDNIGYIAVSEWQDNTAEQFKSIEKDLESQGMQSLIVDVRSNPGGLLSSVVDTLDYILPEGTLVYTEDKYGQRQTYTSDASCLNLPIAVLVNGNSASASEIFAGAIKDYNYGTLIGTTTFGKGIVQTIFQLTGGDALKVTTAKYYTPNGNYIHGVGIDPDIELEYEYSGPTDEAYDMQYDNQLQKAIEILK